MIPDNLKSAVIKADRYEPLINDSYQAFSQHYGCPIMPAQPYKPQDKGKVEAAVLVVERWVLAQLRYHTFHSLAALNQAIKTLMQDLNQQPMKGYAGVLQDSCPFYYATLSSFISAFSSILSGFSHTPPTGFIHLIPLL